VQFYVLSRANKMMTTMIIIYMSI